MLSRALRKIFLAPIFSRASRLLYIGSRNRDYWIWLLGGANTIRSKLYHLPYPALLAPDTEEPRSTPPDADTFRLLYVGRLEPAKAVDRLLRALAALRDTYPVIKLEIIGGGTQEPDLKILAAELRLTEAVTFHGSLASDQVSSAYRNADLFVLPSNIEPWGLVVNEALLAGVPVMCPFWVGAAADLVIEGVTGYVLSANDPATIAAEIVRAGKHRASLRSLGRAGRALVAQGPWNVDAAGRTLASLLDSLTQGAVPSCAASRG